MTQTGLMLCCKLESTFQLFIQHETVSAGSINIGIAGTEPASKRVQQ